MSDNDNVFSRWSRRKRRAKPDDPAPEAPESLPGAKPEQTPEPEPETEEEEAALLERLNLPHPESLGAGDDFSIFMRAGVPEFLRKRALRVLWRSNPVLANIDGLNDYDDDFTSPELTQKVLATAYKVGRGILRDDPGPDEVDAADKPTPEPDADPVVDEPVEPVADMDDRMEPDDPDPVDHPPQGPRRMRFET